MLVLMPDTAANRPSCWGGAFEAVALATPSVPGTDERR
jgi:hypothetical protein